MAGRDDRAHPPFPHTVARQRDAPLAFHHGTHPVDRGCRAGTTREAIALPGPRRGDPPRRAARGHPKRHAAVSAQVVPRGDDAAAVRAIDAAHRAASAPFTRCPRCNTALLRRSAFEAQGEVPGRVTRAGGPLRHCPSCGQWYWIGSHVARIREWLESTLERGIEPPDAGGPPAPWAGAQPQGTRARPLAARRRPGLARPGLAHPAAPASGADRVGGTAAGD